MPKAKVVNLNNVCIMSGSGEGSSTENIGRGPWWETEPEQDGDGYVWVESKGQYVFDIFE